MGCLPTRNKPPGLAKLARQFRTARAKTGLCASKQFPPAALDPAARFRPNAAGLLPKVPLDGLPQAVPRLHFGNPAELAPSFCAGNSYGRSEQGHAVAG